MICDTSIIKGHCTNSISILNQFSNPCCTKSRISHKVCNALFIIIRLNSVCFIIIGKVYRFCLWDIIYSFSYCRCIKIGICHKVVCTSFIIRSHNGSCFIIIRRIVRRMKITEALKLGED